MLFFGWAALPGIVLGLLLTITRGMTLEDSIGVIFHFLIPTVLCWGGYRVFVPRRQQISHGNVRLMPQRLFWQMLLPSLIFLILSQLAEYLGIHPRATGLIGVNPLSLRSLITFQALMAGCFDRRAAMLLSDSNYPQPALYSGFCFSDSPADRSKNKALRIYFMGGSADLLLVLLLMPLNSTSTIFSTNYTFVLGYARDAVGGDAFWYRFISLVWSPILIVIIHFHYQYLPHSPIYSNQLGYYLLKLSGVFIYYRLYGDAGDAAEIFLCAHAQDGLYGSGCTLAQYPGAKSGVK